MTEQEQNLLSLQGTRGLVQYNAPAGLFLLEAAQTIHRITILLFSIYLFYFSIIILFVVISLY